MKVTEYPVLRMNEDGSLVRGQVEVKINPSPLTIEQEIEETKRVVEEMLKNPAVKDNALVNALYIQEKFRDNWFTIDQLMRKTSLKSYEPASDILTVLCMLGLAYREEKSKGVIKYKITVSTKDRIAILNEELVEAKVKVRDLEGQIEKLLKS